MQRWVRGTREIAYPGGRGKKWETKGLKKKTETKKRARRKKKLSTTRRGVLGVNAREISVYLGKGFDVALGEVLRGGRTSSGEIEGQEKDKGNGSVKLVIV